MKTTVARRIGKFAMAGMTTAIVLIGILVVSVIRTHLEAVGVDLRDWSHAKHAIQK